MVYSKAKWDGVIEVICCNWAVIDEQAILSASAFWKRDCRAKCQYFEQNSCRCFDSPQKGVLLIRLATVWNMLPYPANQISD